MASPRKTDDRMVARTYRAAIRLGEDFITLEETITLPIDASDEEVKQAVDLGWQIYRAQREAAELQIADIREHSAAPPAITIRDPESPASEKQRHFIGTLQENLGWNSEQLASYAGEQQIDLVTLTKGQASTFIDGLKKIADERSTYGDAGRARPEPAAPAAPRDDSPANEKQIAALERLARQHAFDLSAELRRRFEVTIEQLSYEQASGLLRELQRTAPRRPADPAL